MIDINNITVGIGTKLLLDHASAHISDGQKVGLIGHNGCGKSTLFRVFKGEMETESGEIFFPSGYKVIFVEQEMGDISLPILEYVLLQDKERTELLARLETAPNEELAEIHERLNLIEAYSAEAKAAEVLNGLGFSNEDFTRPISEFSGGWRMRLALASALFQYSDVLLLDEPTNHLDLEASIWLENHLRRYKGTLILISHDKYILNDLCDYIIQFENKKLNTYSGNYDTFQRTRAMQRELLGKQAIKQERHRKHLQSFVDRFRYKASKAKQAQSRIKMLEKLDVITLPDNEFSSQFSFPSTELLAPPLISVEDGVIGYDDKVVLKNLNFRIVENDRIAFLGANGNGKSTLAKLLSDRLPLMSGKISKTPKLQVGYFAQHQSEELPLEMTAVAFMSTLMIGSLEPKVRAHLARFGLGQEKAVTKIADLSGGEKARLLFAAMSFKAPQLLILDEPTNHLDIEGREALIEALNEYQGSVILITHDLHLIELVADNLWLIKDGTCKNYDGDLEDYKRLLLGGGKEPKKEPAKKNVEETKENKKSNNYQEIKQLSSQILRAEKQVHKLQEQKSQLEEELNKTQETATLIALQKEISYLENQIAVCENDWLELSDQLEKCR